MGVVLEHATDFVAKRLAPAAPPKDGNQTPMRHLFRNAALVAAVVEAAGFPGVIHMRYVIVRSFAGLAPDYRFGLSLLCTTRRQR